VAERVPQSVALRVTFDAFLTGTTTPATGKTIAIQISKNGGAFANPAAGALNATEVSAGTYYADLGAADIGTLGPLVFKGAEASIDNVKAHMRVVNANTLGAAALPNVAAGAADSIATTTDGAPIQPPAMVVHANIVSINGTVLQGDGTSIPWGPG
jgi:hypothetical protein